MPVWHGYTEPYRQQGKLQVAGIIQEQHPDRARLFMQWKEMDWPILVDSLNRLAIDVVPLTLLIDEYGVIRKVRPREEDLQEFLKTRYSPPDPESRVRVQTDPTLQRIDDLFLWQDPSKLDQVIEGYSQLLPAVSDPGPIHFRLGVAHRRRHDSAARRPGDFEKAVEQWEAALETNPNQYIWRRRIQQYGPRLDKPYPFYDWVRTARAEIRQRGGDPFPLEVEPAGAEFAEPAKEFVASAGDEVNPDERGRILRDEEGFVEVESVVVPARVEAGKAGRLHLEFRPNPRLDAHWNNESEGLRFWLDPPAGWSVERRMSTLPNPPQATSSEVRHLELEFQTPGEVRGAHRLAGFALYYVCEGRDGTCVYRRQDILVEVQVR